MRRTFRHEIENISYERRENARRAFAVRSLRRHGITSPPRKLLHPSAPSHLRSSPVIFFLVPVSSLGLYARTSFVRSRKSRDPEMYAVCDVFEALCGDTIGIPAVCSRLSNPPSTLVASRNRLISVRYFLAFLKSNKIFFNDS